MRGLLCLGVIVGLLVACAAQTRFTNAWRDPAYVGQRFSRLMVIGFGDDGASRRVFEDGFVRSLQAAGIPAVASYTLLPGLGGSDWPRMRDAVGTAGVDGVLTIRMVGVEKWTNVTPAQFVTMPIVSPRRGLSGYYSAFMVTPPMAQTYDVMTLETSLWKVPGESLVWSGTSETFAPRDLKDMAVGLAQEMVRTLRGLGLL